MGLRFPEYHHKAGGDQAMSGFHELPRRVATYVSPENKTINRKDQSENRCYGI